MLEDLPWLAARIAAERAKKCPACKGLRILYRCLKCGGLGRTDPAKPRRRFMREKDGSIQSAGQTRTELCGGCGGNGMAPCSACGGSGRKRKGKGTT